MRRIEMDDGLGVFRGLLWALLFETAAAAIAFLIVWATTGFHFGGLWK